MTPYRMKRARFITITAGRFATVGIVTAPARAAQFEFKCSSNFTTEHPSIVRLTQMWKAVERESGGRIHTQVFPNNMLGGDPAVIAQLRLGAVAFDLAPTGSVAPLVPAADVANLGFVFRDADEAIHVMEGPLGAYCREELSANGLHAMRSVWNNGMVSLSTSTHPIRTPDDMRGFKILTSQSKILFDLYKDLGASPLATSSAEYYTLLQTKLGDGYGAPLLRMQTGRWWEVQKYISLTNHQWAGEWLITNNEIWKSLPPDLQGIVERNNTKYANLVRRDTQLLTASAQDMLSREGLVFNRVDQEPFRARLGSYYASWETTFGAREWGLLRSSLGRAI